MAKADERVEDDWNRLAAMMNVERVSHNSVSENKNAASADHQYPSLAIAAAKQAGIEAASIPIAARMDRFRIAM